MRTGRLGSRSQSTPPMGLSWHRPVLIDAVGPEKCRYLMPVFQSSNVLTETDSPLPPSPW